MIRRTLLCIAWALAAAAVSSTAVHAAFPGTNGRIAYESDLPGNIDVYAVQPDGSDREILASSTSFDRFPAWSPDGSKIAFQSNRYAGFGFDLFVMNADGTGLKRLTSGPMNEIQPAWSPDGSKIAFARLDPDWGAYDIWIVNAEDGSAGLNLTQNPASDARPAWSPDGRSILFETNRDGDTEIYEIEVGAAPSTAVNLTHHSAEDTDPSWSPSGDRIAFVSDRDGGGWTRIWTMFSDGTIQEMLQGSELGDRDPAWSPDGLKIAFSRMDVFGNEGVWTTDLDGFGMTLVAADGTVSRAPDWQTVPDEPSNQAPAANAGGDGQAECTSADGAVIHLDGTASSDPDSTPGTNDDIAVFEWFVGYGTADQAPLGKGMTLDVHLPPGAHAVTLLVTDRSGMSDTDIATWNVVDPQPPSISAAVSPGTLWPPDHRLVPVHADVVAVGGLCSPAPAVVLRSVTSSEADDASGGGDGHTRFDIRDAEIGEPDVDLLLRAERMGNGPGRSYTLTYAIVDGAEPGATATATVFVPHSMQGQPEFVEAVRAQAKKTTAPTCFRPVN